MPTQTLSISDRGASAPKGCLRLAVGYSLASTQCSLSSPAGLIPVNELGLAVLELCDGTLDARAIEGRLRARAAQSQDIVDFILALIERGWVVRAA